MFDAWKKIIKTIHKLFYANINVVILFAEYVEQKNEDRFCLLTVISSETHI